MDLYAVYLGGDLSPGRMGEDHEVVFVVGEDARDAKRRAKQKWGGSGKAHIDAVQQLGAVDGYEVSLEHVGGGDRTVLDTTYDPLEP